MNESETKPEDLEQQEKDQALSESIGEEKPEKKTSRVAVLSLILVFAGLFFSVLSVLSLGRLQGMWFLLGKISLLFMCAAAVLGIIALVVISFRIHKKSCSCAIAGILIGIVFGGAIAYSWQRIREFESRMRCPSNLAAIGRAIIIYADNHNGYLPAATNWCDLLVENVQDLSRDVFKCPSARRGACNYAFNKNLDGLRLADVPDDVVLVFEADGGWNAAGGVELLDIRHSNGRFCFVLFADGIVEGYDAAELARRPLRWKP